MPSIEAVEQFKSIVQNLAREPEIRAEKGLPLEEILPPESQLDDDLAGLLGGMPESGAGDGTAVADEADLGSPAGPADDSLEDLFSASVPDEEAAGPSLDDLLGPPLSQPELEPEVPAAMGDDPFGDLLSEPPGAETLEALDEVPSAADDDFSFADPAGSWEEAPASQAPSPRQPGAGVSPEDMDDAFFQNPGEDLFDQPEEAAAAGGDDDFDFGEPLGDADFPELAGFADTKEEDVEAFDALQEADEFQLGDFESQFGITADDHTDAEILNPAQAIDLSLESEAAAQAFSLTDTEFVSVQRALGSLPLNLKLAVEELIGEKEGAFEDLERVINLLIAQAPARTLASAVGKILGRKIVIPPGFERGTGAELEARHGTLAYHLRTIIWPVLRVSMIVSALAAILVLLGWNFLLRPWKANDLYDRGLVAVRLNDGETADSLFAQAWYYWPVQERFFQYAEAYQDTGDYDRARRKYLELLRPSVRPYRDDDKVILEQRFGAPLAPLPDGLEGEALTARLTEKKAAAQAYYAYVVRLLSSSGSGPEAENDVPGEVILGNPDTKGILDYSRFETDFGFDGRDKEAHFRRADAILRPLLTQSPGHREGLLRKADNFLAWSRALSSRQSLDQANSALSEYLRLYRYDAPVTWRFVRLFLLQDEAGELLRLRDRIDGDQRMAMDGETMALLARWLLDQADARRVQDRMVPLTQKTIEEEYGIRPMPVEPPAAVVDAPPESSSASASAAHSLTRSEAGDTGGLEGSETKAPELTPPYKYPYSSQPYRPDYLDKVDTLLLRSMETQKSLPELHYQLSRFYRQNKNREDERRALAAADAYFQRLEPRKSRLNDRPAMRVATSNRIGEIFDEEGQALQAEKYYLDAQKTFEAFRAQGLVTLDTEAARLFRNLGNLYYRQTPGVEASGRGTVPGGWDQAMTLFQRAEQGRWEEPAVLYRLGVIHYERQEFDKAVVRFFSLDRPGNLGESSGRENVNLLYSMGNALFRSGNFASAEGYYRELLALLQEQRARLVDFDPVGRAAHRAIAQRLYEVWNNLAAAEYRATNAFRSGTPEFRQALAALTTARALAQILGRDLYEDKTELDVTAVDAGRLREIRDDEAQIITQTRKEKGLIEANLQVLALIELASPSRKEALAQQLEIFARIPLELDQAEAP